MAADGLTLEALYNETLRQQLVNKNMQLELDYIRYNNDSFFLVTMGVIIFFMQAGFAFLEAGSVRSKNTTNILIKNLLDSCISAMSYWILGYGLAYGEDIKGLFGSSKFVLAFVDASEYPSWFFQFTFAATAATIVSGALAERCEFVAYFAYCFVLTGFVYPVITHWCWDSNGWLSVMGYKDFAGSGVVHLHGATCALVGAIILGARIGRFDKPNRPVQPLLGHSVPFAALGGFILMFGFFAFNGGSQASISSDGDGKVVALAMINTIINGAVSTLTVLFLTRFSGRWSILKAINAALAGMVTACAGCDVFQTWCSVVSGVGSGLTYMFVSWLMVKAKIDDPVDAVAGGGLWGLFITPIFMDGGIIWEGHTREAWRILGINLLGAVAIIAWSLVIIGPLFLILRLARVFRVSEEVEVKGLDIKKHGEPAYPLAAYGHGWLEYEADSNSTSPARKFSAGLGQHQLGRDGNHPLAGLMPPGARVLADHDTALAPSMRRGARTADQAQTPMVAYDGGSAFYPGQFYVAP